MDIALNRKPASRIDFAAFSDVAAELDCMGVDPITTSAGGSSTEWRQRAALMARARDLTRLWLSEVYPFEDWRTERRTEVADLIESAHAAGADTINLIPRVDSRDPHAAVRARALLRDVLAEIDPLRAGTSVVALLEPIVFTMCSMRFQREAIAAIEGLGLDDRFGIARWRRTRISSCRVSQRPPAFAAERGI